MANLGSMRRELAPFPFGIGALAALAASLVALGTRSAFAAEADRFRDIVAAEAVAEGYVKANDQRFALVWIGVFAAVMAAGLVFRSRLPAVVPTLSTGIVRCLIWLLATFGAATLAYTHWSSATAVVLGTLPVLLAAAATARHPSRGEVWAAAALTVAGAAGAATAVSVASIGMFAVPVRWTTWPVFAALLGVSAFAAAMLRPAHRSRLIAYAQVPIPFLLLPLGHSAVEVAGRKFVAPTSGLLLTVILVTVVTAIGFAIAHCRSCATGIRWTSIVAIYAFLATPDIAPTLPLLYDDFHAGELAVQLPAVHQGLSLYQSFIPTPGAIGAAYGAINALLGHSYDTFPRAIALAAAGVAGFTGWLLSRLLAPSWTLALAPFVAFAFRSDRLMLVVPSLLLLVSPVVWNRLPVLISLWPVILAVNLLLAPASGIALIVGAVPAVALRVWSLARGESGSRWSVVLALGVAAGAIAPLVPTLADATRSSLAQGATNLLVWGSPLFWPGSGDPSGIRLVARWTWWAATASGWWLGLPLALVVATGGSRSPLSWVSDSRRGLLFAGAGVLVAFTPYAIGRVDPLGLTRITSVTITFAGVVLPAALLIHARSDYLRCRLQASAVALLLLPTVLMSTTEIRVLSGVRAIARVDAGVPGSAAGAPALGRLPVVNSQYGMTRRAVRSIVDDVLDSEESYVDFSNNQALYAYFGRPIPRLHAASAFLATSELQNEALATFNASPPALALITAGTATLGGGVLDWSAVRSYRMIRWFSEREYIALGRGGVVVFVRADRVSRAQAAGLTPVSPEVLDAAVSAVDLRSVPAAWGASWDTLRWRFSSGDGAAGERPDFALVSSSCKGAQVEVRWPAAGTGAVSFVAGEINLVPLGARPSYLRSEVDAADIEARVVDNAERCDGATVSVRGLYRLVR